MLNKVFIIEKEQLKQTISSLSSKIESLEEKLAQRSSVQGGQPEGSEPIQPRSESGPLSCYPLLPVEIPAKKKKTQESAGTQTDSANCPALLTSEIKYLKDENKLLREHATESSVKFAVWRAESERALGNKVQKEKILMQELKQTADALHTLSYLKASQKQCLPVVSSLQESIATVLQRVKHS